MSIQQLMLGVGASKKTYLDDVFSTYVYEGTGSARSINNGINLSGEGGMTWIKSREETEWHHLFDTVRGAGKGIFSNSNYAQITDTTRLSSFNNNGFSLGTEDRVNKNDIDFSSWTFRKAKGFFDIVTYTGNGTSGRAISHNLGCNPGFVIVKRTVGGVGDWKCLHRYDFDKYLELNNSQVAASSSIDFPSHPTSTTFTVSSDAAVNKDGDSYVAYLFAGGESTAATARSVEFDGAEDSLLIESNSDLAFGTGDFTIEFWVKPQTLGYAILFDMRPNPAATQGAYPVIYLETDGTLRYYANSGDQITGNQLSKDQWQHIAVSRSGTSTKMFLNGIQQGSTYSDSTNYLNGDTTIGLRANGSTGDFDGHISNVRCVKGTAVYTSSFRVPTKPLTNITNTVLLCCNDSSQTGSTVTPGTITNNGSTASSDSPFDDPAGFAFGENGHGIIKCGSYKGNGSSTGPEINLGFEPQWVLIKNTESAESWAIYDSMRGIVSGGNDPGLYANTTNSEYSANIIDLTSTGFKLVSSAGDVNEDNKNFIYVCIRRSDGYCGKPPELGTGVFAMDTSAATGTIPDFDSGFPVDFSFFKNKTTTDQWYTGARLTGQEYMSPSATDAGADSGSWVWDSNVGWIAASGFDSNHQAFMWKRHAGFDVVTYEGDGVAGRQIPHSMNKTPEMIWIKKRSATGEWIVGHHGVNGGTNPWEYEMLLHSTNAQGDSANKFNDTAPISTHFTVGNSTWVNGDGDDYIVMLFASVDKISKCGFYTGSTSNLTIDCGFQPRFVIIKSITDAGYSWVVLDSNRTWGSGNDNYLQLNSNAAEVSYEMGAPTSSGFTVDAGSAWVNGSTSRKYIYYAHA